MDNCKLYTCTLCNWRGLFNHPFILAFEKALSLCSWLDFLRAWSCSCWKCSHFPSGEQNLTSDEVTVAHKKQRKVWLVTRVDFISISICMNTQSGSIKYLFDLLKKYMSPGAGQHIWILAFFLSHKNLDIFSKQWTRIALPFQCNYKFAPFFPLLELLWRTHWIN